MKTGGEIPGALVPVSLERRAGRRMYGHDSQVHIEYETQNYDGISTSLKGSQPWSSTT